MKVYHYFLVICFFFVGFLAKAQEDLFKHEITIGHDNDITVFGRPTDWHYTYGIHLDVGWIPQKETLLSRLFRTKTGYLQRAGLHIQAYTPDYTLTYQIVKTRQPYAGWGYADFENTYGFSKSFLKFKLDLGVLGPAVQAGEIQNFIHKYISYDLFVPQWEDQIPNKVGVNFHATYALDFYTEKWLDIYGIAEASAGTIFTFIEPGIHLRLGKFAPLSKTTSQRNSLFAQGEKEFFLEAAVATKFSAYNATIEDADANGTVLVPNNLVNHAYLNASLGTFMSFSRYSLGLKWNYTEGEIKGNRPHRYMVLKASYRFK